MNRRKLTVFFVLLGLYTMSTNFVHPVTPTLIVERSLDSSMFGVAMAAMNTTFFLTAPFWGKLCGYIPTKRVMLIGGIGYAVGQGIFGLAWSEVQVIAGRMFAGVFSAAVFTALLNYIVNISTDGKERGRNLTLMVTVQNVSGAIGYFVGGMLGLISVEAAFAAQLIALIVMTVAFFFTCVDDTPFKARPSEPLTLRAANPFSAFLSARSFMTPMLALIFVILAIAGIGQTSFDQCFNYYIKDQFGLSSAYNGTFKAVIAVLILAANSTICMRLTTRTDVNRTFLPIMLTAASALGVVLLLDTLPAFVVVYVLFSVLNSMRMPLFQNMTSMRATPENSNAVMGFYQSMGSLGGIFGALFAGLIYDINVRLPFILAFIAYSCAAALSALYVKRYNRERVK